MSLLLQGVTRVYTIYILLYIPNRTWNSTRISLMGNYNNQYRSGLCFRDFKNTKVKAVTHAKLTAIDQRPKKKIRLPLYSASESLFKSICNCSHLPRGRENPTLLHISYSTCPDTMKKLSLGFKTPPTDDLLDVENNVSAVRVYRRSRPQMENKTTKKRENKMRWKIALSYGPRFPLEVANSGRNKLTDKCHRIW